MMTRESVTKQACIYLSPTRKTLALAAATLSVSRFVQFPIFKFVLQNHFCFQKSVNFFCEIFVSLCFSNSFPIFFLLSHLYCIGLTYCISLHSGALIRSGQEFAMAPAKGMYFFYCLKQAPFPFKL